MGPPLTPLTPLTRSMRLEYDGDALKTFRSVNCQACQAESITPDVSVRVFSALGRFTHHVQVGMSAAGRVARWTVVFFCCAFLALRCEVRCKCAHNEPPMSRKSKRVLPLYSLQTPEAPHTGTASGALHWA